jgi:predicted small lipoprotein YifL
MEGQAGMTLGARSLLLLLAVAFLASACGRMGPIRPPGPPEEITHPRQYPNR